MNKFFKNYESLPTGTLIGSTRTDPRNVLGEKNRVTFREKLNFSPQALKLKDIAHRFWLFSWAFLGLP